MTSDVNNGPAEDGGSFWSKFCRVKAHNRLRFLKLFDEEFKNEFDLLEWSESGAIMYSGDPVSELSRQILTLMYALETTGR